MATQIVDNKDFTLIHVRREEVEGNQMPNLLHHMERKEMRKLLRVSFYEEGAYNAAIIDYCGGKTDFFESGMKALFQAGEVFSKTEGSSFYFLN